ncbi:MAG: methyltransferase domain-containing protein [Nocardioides sp.]|uniref:methyltransferase domain-containing protein n=1 Tax=Nocardioides sp. TaxID=35761 RepID=UPI0039E4A18A
MDCHYFAADLCRSCTHLGTPYDAQLAAKQTRVAGVLGLPDGVWEPAVASAESGFRNKAKMVAGGTLAAPTLGILDPHRHGVDLIACGLHSRGIRSALPTLRDLVTDAGLTPYSVPQRRGELKHVLVTESPDGELMVRWVLRSTEAIARIRKRLPALRAALPIAVATVNLQPAHAAVLEGTEERVLTETDTLVMRINGLGLRLSPQSFFQTNTGVAAALYRHARDLVDGIDPDGTATIWDLYCGVGGFGLHLARAGRRVIGVESSAAAIGSATATATAHGLRGTTWLAGDATAFATSPDRPEARAAPDVVVLNPPRRGIGPQLAGWVEASGVPYVLYSSCNAVSLAGDLASMPSLAPVSARLLDMFPQTDHHEVLVLLRRR